MLKIIRSYFKKKIIQSYFKKLQKENAFVASLPKTTGASV